MKIGLDAGHCRRGADTGARGCGMKEEDMTREIANEVSLLLQKQGHQVVICNIDQANNLDDSLAHRYTTANNANVDKFVSIHINGGGGQGSEIFTYKARKLVEADRILRNLNKLGFNNRGIKDAMNYDGRGHALSVIKNTKMEGMLIEVCFIDTQSDVNLYKNLGAKKIAIAIVEGLLNKNLQYLLEEQPKKVEPIKKEDKLYRVQVGAYKDKNNAEETLGQLKKKGFAGFIKEE